MPFDLTNLVPIYQENIDLLIAQMGKDVILYFESLITNVDTTFNDQIRPSSIRKPDYKETSSVSAPTTTVTTSTIKALIKHNPKEYENFGLRVDYPNKIVRLKTYLTDVPNLKRCSYIIPNSASAGIIGHKYYLVIDPIPIGLKEDRYAVSYWSTK